MNKKKFKKRLDNALNNGVISVYFIESLFKEEKKSLFNNEKIEKLIQDNFLTIMEGVGKGNKDVFIDALYAHEDMREFLNREDTIKQILDTIDYFDFECVAMDGVLNKRCAQFINDNIDYVLDNYSIKKITCIYERLELNEEMKIKIDKYLNEKKEEFLTEILTGTLSIKGKVDKKQLDVLLSVITPLIDEILEKQNCKITDIKILSCGGFSNVLSIGDKVVKVGLCRETFNIPNDERILQPYLRRDLSEEYGVAATIEVSDLVDTNVSLSEDEMYSIYKEIRDRGIICGDFKYGNIGRLVKDNTPRNNPKNGMIGNISKTLKEGEYVILDSDFIYAADDPNVNLTSELSRKFESRYKKQKINSNR